MSARRLRVVVLTTSFPLEPDAAAGVFVARLCESAAGEVDYVVVTPAGAAAARAFERGGVEVRPFRYAPRALRRLAQVPGGIPVALARHRWLYPVVPALLAAMLAACWRAARGADVIHANWAVCGAVAGVAGRLRGCPVVTTLRGEDITRARRGRLDRALVALCLRGSTHVVAVSRAIAHWLSATFPQARARVRTIHNGVAPAFLELASAGQPAGVPLALVCVGSLIPRKGIDGLLRGLAGAVEAGADVLLEIAGDGPEAPRLAALAQTLGLAGRVRLLGAVAPEAVPGVLARAHGFVLASHSEGRPNALIEAMAAGRAVIATDIDGVSELIEHGESGLLFADGDIEALAGHIRALAADAALRRRLGEGAHRAIVDGGLTWEAAGAHYRALYEEAAAARGGA